MNIHSWFTDLLLRAPGILIGLTFHEYAHGLVAYFFGDNTAKSSGRLTLNPLPHLDPLGTLALLIGPFGWAKPVPVNSMFFKHRRLGIIFVSIAGPVMNILLASGIAWFLVLFGNGLDIGGVDRALLLQIIQYAILINLGLSFFNLIPIPPLDGSNILAMLLPRRTVNGYLGWVRYAQMIFLVFILSDWVYSELHIGFPLFSFVAGPIFSGYVHGLSLLVGVRNFGI
jgi:Zn-dependent protease